MPKNWKTYKLFFPSTDSLSAANFLGSSLSLVPKIMSLPVTIGVFGASGRMGRALQDICHQCTQPVIVSSKNWKTDFQKSDVVEIAYNKRVFAKAIIDYDNKTLDKIKKQSQ